MEAQFLKHLDYLERELLNEQEFVKANESIRSQRDALEDRRQELEAWLNDQMNKASTAERIPGAIRSLLEDLDDMDVRAQKANLQTILKAAYVLRDEIELEFRG